MSVRPSLLILIGAALVAAGVTISLVPFDTDISYVAPGVAVYGPAVFVPELNVIALVEALEANRFDGGEVDPHVVRE